MDEESSKRVAKCYEKAREARKRSNRAMDEGTRLHFLALESRWLSLVRRYRARSDLATSTDEVAVGAKGLNRQHQQVPRVMCPQCGQGMVICRLEHRTISQCHADLMTFVCECGFTLQQTIERVY